MNIPKLIGLCAALMFASVLTAQTITVRDNATKEPVAGAVLTCTSNKATVTADNQGRADIAPLKDCGAIEAGHLSFATRSLSWADLSASNELALTYRVNTLAEAVTSASRFEEKRRDVPERIDIIKRRDITFMDQPTMAELLQNTGSLFVQKSQLGGGSPVIRGFEASRVLLVVDGVRMNNAIYRAGHLQDIITFDQSMLDRVEVVSGPNSVAYGSDALGGTIHMITRTPRFNGASGLKLGGDAFFRYGTAAMEKTAHLGIELRGKSVASFTSITASDFGDLRTGSTRDPFHGDWGLRPFYVERENDQDVIKENEDSNVQVGTAYKQIDLLEKLRIRSGPRTVHQLNFQLSTSTDVPRYDRLSEYSLDTAGGFVPAQAEWYYGPQKRMLVAYTLEMDREKGIFSKLRFTPSYQDLEQSRHSRGWGSSRLGNNIENVSVLGVNLDLEKRIGKHEIRYGAEYYANTTESKAFREHIATGEITYRTSRYPGEGSMNNMAVYLSHTMEINEHWVISEGLRFTNVALEATFADTNAFQFLNGTYTQNSSALTWRAGIMYMPGRDWRVSLLGSSGFRAPNIDDLGKVFDGVPGDVIVPNTDLKPETTTNFELALSKTFDKRVTVDLNGFYTLYNNALTVDDFTVNGEDSIDYDGTLSHVSALTNKREAYLYGASGQFTAHFDEHFSLTSSVTWTYARIKTDTVDQPLDHIPPVYGRTGLAYQAKRLRGEVYVVYNGWKRLSQYSPVSGSEDNLIYATAEGTPAWYTLNARMSCAFSRNVSLQLGLENIIDQHYRAFASGISGAGRNFTISLRANF